MQKLHHRLGAGVDLELFINPLGIGADGGQADAEVLADLLVKQALDQQGKHLLEEAGAGATHVGSAVRPA